MAIATGNDPLSGAPDAGVRGRSAYGAAPSNQPSPTSAMAFPLPDPLADSSQNYMQHAVGPGPSAVSFPLQDPVAASGAGVHPWAVRWHTPVDEKGDPDGDPQLEVYIPYGALVIAGSSPVYYMNQKGKETGGGHDGYEFQGGDGDVWFKIPGNFAETGSKEYRIDVHVKGFVRMGTGTNQYTEPNTFVQVVAVKESDWDDESKNAQWNAGDIVTTTIAYVTTPEKNKPDGSPGSPHIRRTMNSTIMVPMRYIAAMSSSTVMTPDVYTLTWLFDYSDSTGQATLKDIEISYYHRDWSIGGTPIPLSKPEVDGAVISGTDDCTIYLEIKYKKGTDAPELTIKECKTSSLPESKIDCPIVQLYRMKGPMLIADTRINLMNYRFYTYIQTQ